MNDVEKSRLIRLGWQALALFAAAGKWLFAGAAAAFARCAEGCAWIKTRCADALARARQNAGAENV